MLIEHRVAIIINLLEHEKPPYFPNFGQDDDDQMEGEIYLAPSGGGGANNKENSNCDSNNNQTVEQSTSESIINTKLVKSHLSKIRIKLDHIEQREHFHIKRILFIHVSCGDS